MRCISSDERSLASRQKRQVATSVGTTRSTRPSKGRFHCLAGETSRDRRCSSPTLTGWAACLQTISVGACVGGGGARGRTSVESCCDCVSSSEARHAGRLAQVLVHPPSTTSVCPVT